MSLTIAEISFEVAKHPSLKSFPRDWIQDQIEDLCNLLISVDMLYLLKKPIR